MTHLRSVSLALLLLVSVSASAHDSRLLNVLKAIDLVPDAATLRAITSTPELALRDVAMDAKADTYLRKRAISLLSLFPSVRTGAILEAIADDSVANPELRWIALYTRIRGFASSAPAGAQHFAAGLLKSAVPNDRDAAVRGLRWTSGPASDALLAGAERDEKDPTVLAAIRHVRRARTAAQGR